MSHQIIRFQECCLKELCQKLDEFSFLKDTELTEYSALSGRLASLRYTEKYITQFAEFIRLHSNQDHLNEIFTRYFHDNSVLMTSLSGETLGKVLCHIQDLNCFINHTTVPFRTDTCHMLKEWTSQASLVHLDAAALMEIADYLELYPIPEDERIPVMKNPQVLQTLKEQKKVDAIMETSFLLPGCSPNEDIIKVPLTPLNSLLHWDISFNAEGYSIIPVFKNSEEMAVHIYYHGREREPATAHNLIQLMRQGTLPFTRNKKVPNKWTIHYDWIHDPESRCHFSEKEIHVLFTSGIRATLSLEGLPRQLEYRPMLKLARFLQNTPTVYLVAQGMDPCLPKYEQWCSENGTVRLFIRPDGINYHLSWTSAERKRISYIRIAQHIWDVRTRDFLILTFSELSMLSNSDLLEGSLCVMLADSQEWVTLS